MIYNPKLIVKENSWTNDDCVDRARVIVVGPASPSTGGIPSYIDELLASQLKNCYPLELFDPLAIKSRSEKQESRLNFREIVAGLKVLKSFVIVMGKFDPALVHIHTSSYWGFYEKAIIVIIVKYIFKKRIILHIHGGGFDVFYQKSRCKWFINKIIRMADKALIVSKQFKETIGTNDMIVVDNATRFSNELVIPDMRRLRDKYYIPRKKKVFLSVAILEKRKGIRETLEIFKKILSQRNDFIYIVAGEGPEKSNIISLIKSSGLSENVKVMDFVTGQEKEEILYLSDVFILNSSNESFGVSLIEAVSHGLFVITTPVGIASDAENVFNDGNCIRVPIKNTKALEGAILTVLDKKIDIDTITKKNFYNFKNRFDVEPVFEKMRQIYEEVLKVRGSN